MKPVLLKNDAGTGRARRAIERMLAKEKQTPADQADNKVNVDVLETAQSL
jgi:hypothetical protein